MTFAVSFVGTEFQFICLYCPSFKIEDSHDSHWKIAKDACDPLHFSSSSPSSTNYEIIQNIRI